MTKKLFNTRPQILKKLSNDIKSNTNVNTFKHEIKKFFLMSFRKKEDNIYINHTSVSSLTFPLVLLPSTTSKLLNPPSCLVIPFMHFPSEGPTIKIAYSPAICYAIPVTVFEMYRFKHFMSYHYRVSGVRIPGGHSTVKNTGGGAGSIVWGLRFWLEKIFWGSSKILI